MARMSDQTAVGARTDAGGVGPWLGWGLLAGFLAGVVFIALTSWFATSMGNPQLAPFKVIATLAQGPPPMQATVWIGMAIHSVLSALFGLVFAAAVAPRRGSSGGSIIWAGLIFGGLIYIIDFQVLSRFVPQFSAFLQATNQPFEVTVHLVFGAVLAALLAAWPTRAPAAR
jgi:vacuolar-type H+-ATPase subunit I/STV1